MPIAVPLNYFFPVLEGYLSRPGIGLRPLVSSAVGTIDISVKLITEFEGITTYTQLQWPATYAYRAMLGQHRRRCWYISGDGLGGPDQS